MCARLIPQNLAVPAMTHVDWASAGECALTAGAVPVCVRVRALLLLLLHRVVRFAGVCWRPRPGCRAVPDGPDIDGPDIDV